jgi:hypothetical protein
MAQRTIPTPPGLDEQGNPVDVKPYGRSYGTINICKIQQRGGIDKVFAYICSNHLYHDMSIKKLN